MVIGWSAGSVTQLPSSAWDTNTAMPASAGRYFSTGSSSWNRPSSNSIISAVPVTGLVMEKMRKMVSVCIGS